MPAGSTVEVDRAPEGDEKEVKISITEPVRKRQAVGVGGKGDDSAGDEGSDADGAGALPDEPDVLPDVPDAPPAPGGDGEEPTP